MPSIAMALATDIEEAVRQVKVERDTWQAVALQYKSAFETQTKRLEELQNICFATQAELMNERAHQHRLHTPSEYTIKDTSDIFGGTDTLPRESSFGTATITSPQTLDGDSQKDLFQDGRNPFFKRVHESADHRDYGTAVLEIGRLLRGPLSPKARAEGLLLKSKLLIALGPTELYESLAACSEALELCDRLSELEAFLPMIQQQRNLIHRELSMSQVSPPAGPAAEPSQRGRSCHDRSDRIRNNKRRSGFDETRSITEELLAELESEGFNYQSRRRCLSAQLKQCAAAKAKRMSIPPRWVASRSDPHP